MPHKPNDQIRDFAFAVDALGGQRATASYLNVSERSIRHWLSGARPLHAGVLRDVAGALIAHADRCRKLERAISPAFAGNLSEEQQIGMRVVDRRRFHQREA